MTVSITAKIRSVCLLWGCKFEGGQANGTVKLRRSFERRRYDGTVSGLSVNVSKFDLLTECYVVRNRTQTGAGLQHLLHRRCFVPVTLRF